MLPAGLLAAREKAMTKVERKKLAEDTEWFGKTFNKKSSRPRDMLKVAKEEFAGGRLDVVTTILDIYLRTPKSAQDNVACALHLLALCYLRWSMQDKAIEFFLASTQAGYEPDWQYIVEIECDRAAAELEEGSNSSSNESD